MKVAEAAQTPVEVVDIDALIHQTAVTDGLNEAHLRAVIHCESHDNLEAVGDGTTSFGVAQIHLPAHPEITKEQALDPSFAIPWMGAEWKAGRAWEWSCARILSYVKS